jgi:hypothetical protein
MIESALDFTADAAIEGQLGAAQFMTQLTVDDDLAVRCVAVMTGHMRASPNAPSAFEMLTVARPQWRHLVSRVLSAAVPCAWDGAAARWVERVAEKTILDQRLTKGTLPDRAWWWFGPGTLPMQRNLCAFAWETDETGMDLYPFVVLRGRWAMGIKHEGEPYRMGPIGTASLRVQFDEPMADIERRWPFRDGTARFVADYARFVITAGSAVASGDLVVRAMPVPDPARCRLEREFPGHSISPSAHTIMRCVGAGGR